MYQGNEATTGISSQIDHDQTGKLSAIDVTDWVCEIQRTAHALEILLEGFREAGFIYELETWRDIADMTLEFHIENLNQTTEGLTKVLGGDSHNPVIPSGDSLLTDAIKRKTAFYQGGYKAARF